MNKCPSCLREVPAAFCVPCAKKLFNGKKVNPVLPFSKPEFNEARLNKSSRLSISGIQIKYSIGLEGNQLFLTETGGRYIVKPIPIGSFQALDQAPANEHLSMQIAGQIFNIYTPPNALMHFSDGEPVYIVKRFDVLPDGNKLLQEDFAQIGKRSEETGGKNYKYDFSYEEIASLMKEYTPAYLIEVEKFFTLVVFNYLICNGDAHIKNFSLIKTAEFGDYKLSPAYDLMNTSIHVNGARDMALDLFADNFMTEAYKYGSKYTRDDFMQFGKKLGLLEGRAKRILDKFITGETEIERLVEISFLSDMCKEQYILSVKNRSERLKK